MISRTGRDRIGRDRGAESTQRAQLPLLDRLIDDAPDVERDPPLSMAEAVSLLRRSVRRDIEALLNARRRWRSWPDGYRELAVSPVGYGVIDFAAGAFNDPEQRDRLRAGIEQTIRRFEPRLAQVRVILVESDNIQEATLRLRIKAYLQVEPAPEPIVFDTLVDPATAEVQVKPNSADQPSSDV
jgi:type VI secretion system protein ImpF